MSVALTQEMDFLRVERGECEAETKGTSSGVLGSIRLHRAPNRCHQA